jgi:hypothetical protein
MFCKGETAAARLFLDAAGVLPPLSTLLHWGRKLLEEPFLVSSQLSFAHL